MAVSDFHLDTRICRKHVPLITQQHRLRHLHSIVGRNMTVECENSSNAGIYFTLHTSLESAAFYTSEKSHSVNPSWKNFEASHFSENVNTAAACIVVKVWVLNESSYLLTEWVVNFSGLSYMGEQVPKEGKKFKVNTLLFGMLEGYYGNISSLQTHQEDEHLPVIDFIPADPSMIRISYSANTVNRIKTMERAIKQTQSSMHKFRRNIEQKLEQSIKLEGIHKQRELLRLRVSILQEERRNQLHYLELLEKQKEQSKQDAESQCNDLVAKFEQLKRGKESLGTKKQQYFQFREFLLKTKAHLDFRRKELVSELCYIYPIIEFPDKKGYSVCGVHLPNSEDFAGHDEMMISVALGYVCHMVLMISQFLNVPLRYPIHYFGSRSTILDYINDKFSEKEREFPLYSKGKDRLHFHYGVYLLNKNIAQLRQYFGLSTVDLRTTLLNLHSLIEQRLKVHNDQNISLSAAVPLGQCFQGLLDSNQKVTSAIGIKTPDMLQSNGNAQTILSAPALSIANGIQQNSLRVKSTGIMEDLKKEIEEMLPNTKAADSSSVGGRGTENLCGNLSCSVDKGLNDIKILQESLESESESSSRNLKSKFRKLGQGCHHSSVPNLTANLSCASINKKNFLTSDRPSDSALKMWTTGSSENNSDEEQVQDMQLNAAGKGDSASENLWYFNYAPMWSGYSNSVSTPGSANFDPLQVDDAKFGDITFNDELSARTDQLANRSGSFHLQKRNLSSLNTN